MIPRSVECPPKEFESRPHGLACSFTAVDPPRLAELSKLKHTILAHRSMIIARVMLEVGKCRTDALVAEILGTLDWLNWLENNAERLLKPEKVKTPITFLGKQSLLLY